MYIKVFIKHMSWRGSNHLQQDCHTVKGIPTQGRHIHGHQLPCREFSREPVEERVYLLLLSIRGRTRPFLELSGLVGPKPRKLGLTDIVKKVHNPLQTDEDSKEFLLKVFIKGGEGTKETSCWTKWCSMFWRIQILWRMMKPLLCLMLLCWF